MSVWEMTFCSPRALTGNSFKRLNEICDVISNCAWKCGRARIMKLTKTTTAWKVLKYGVFSGPYFSVFGLNTEIYRVNLRIQFKYRKIRTRKNSVFGHFSCGDYLRRYHFYDFKHFNFTFLDLDWNRVIIFTILLFPANHSAKAL